MASIMIPLAHKLLTEDFSEDRIHAAEDDGTKMLLKQLIEIAVIVFTDK